MFQLDMMSRTPVYEQIIEQTERYILTKLLKCGDRLPSVRQLSVELSINPNTIQKAYTELDHRGIIHSVPGKGCFVSEDALKIVSNNSKERMSELSGIISRLILAGVTKEQLVSYIDEIFDSVSGRDLKND